MSSIALGWRGLTPCRSAAAEGRPLHGLVGLLGTTIVEQVEHAKENQTQHRDNGVIENCTSEWRDRSMSDRCDEGRKNTEDEGSWDPAETETAREHVAGHSYKERRRHSHAGQQRCSKAPSGDTSIDAQECVCHPALKNEAEHRRSCHCQQP